MPRLLAPALAFALLAALGASQARAAAPLPPRVVIAELKVTEGTDGFNPFEVEIKLEPGFGPGGITGGGQQTVMISAIPGTARPDDFLFNPVTVGLVTGVPQKLKGYILGDNVFEGDETFTLHVASVNGGFIYAQDGLVTIVDDDGAAASRLSIAATRVTEGDTGWHMHEVPVTLAPAGGGTVSVDFETRGGRPELGNDPTWPDYRGTKGTLTFAPGETSKTIPVEIMGDTLWEPDSTFDVVLSNARGALIDGTAGQVTIVNDDPGTKITIDDVQVKEGDAGTSNAVFRIRFDPPAPGGGKVWLTIAGVSATTGEDFDGAGFTVLYPAAGDKEIPFRVEIRGDTTPECDEVLTVQYQGVYLGDDKPHVARVTILDDDGPKTGMGCPDPTAPPPAPTPGTDGGTPPPPPPAPDAGTTPPPAPPAPDAGTTPPPGATPKDTGLGGREGCACDTSASAPSTFVLFVLVGVVLLARRRTLTPTLSRRREREDAAPRTGSGRS